MGCIHNSGAKEEIIISKKIDKELALGKKNDEKRILLLGTGESGKSTIAKQLRLLFGTPYTREELLDNKSQIHFNTIKAIKDLVICLKSTKIQNIQETTSLELLQKLDLTKIEMSNKDLIKAVEQVYSIPEVQEALFGSSNTDISDSTSYFLHSIKRIALDDYIPNEEDIVRARVKTTGINEIKIKYKDLEIILNDAGGQRSERKKWIQCFANATACLYVASSVEYFKSLEEDSDINRMKESLQLFESLSKNQYLSAIPMILFLNKKDLLEEKVSQWPLSTCFEEYTGQQTYRECMDFIKTKYIEAGTKFSSRDLYVQEVCATDRSSIEYVFEACMDIIVQNNLKQLGLG